MMGSFREAGRTPMGFSPKKNVGISRRIQVSCTSSQHGYEWASTWTCGKTVTTFRHRDAPEHLERDETESSSEGSVFNAFHTAESKSECSALTLFIYNRQLGMR